MKTHTWTFSICVLIAFMSHRPAAVGQEATPLQVSPPSLNPVDPAALNAAPAFGDSGPVSNPQNSVAAESSAAAGTTWIPRLRVVLVTSMSEQTEVLLHTFEPNGNSPVFFPGGPKPVIQKSTRTIAMLSQSSVVLTCDDVNVEAASSENGDLIYSFSCKGKAVLSIDSYTVSGDSVSASEGKVTITNAVIKSNQATMTSEKMILKLAILAVQVGAADPSDSLKPTPDPIGADRHAKTPDTFEADKPYELSPAFSIEKK